MSAKVFEPLKFDCIRINTVYDIDIMAQLWYVLNCKASLPLLGGHFYKGDNSSTTLFSSLVEEYLRYRWGQSYRMYRE